MNNHDETRLLLELYADGEIDDGDRGRIERLLEEDAGAREYLLALEEVSNAVKLPIEMATEAISFDGLFERVMADVETPTLAVERSSELEMLAMMFADGEALSAADQDRVDAYLSAVPEAREGVEAVRELGELTRMPIELAAESVDFDRLAARIQDAVMAEPTAQVAPAQEASAPGLWERIVGFFGEHRGVFVSAMVSAALVAFLVPRLTSTSPQATAPTPAPTEVHNHYYGAYGAESVNYQPGYWGASQPGDMEDNLAPVIWIAPEPIEKVQTPTEELVPITLRPGERSL